MVSRLIPFLLTLLLASLVLGGCGGSRFVSKPEVTAETQTQAEVIPEPELVQKDILSVGIPEQLTFSENPSAFGSFHPDSERIVFQSQVDGLWQLFELSLVEPSPIEGDGMDTLDVDEGNAIQPLVESNSNDESPMWNADGSKLLFVSSEAGDKLYDRNVLTFNPELNIVMPFVESDGDDWNPVPLPDGRVLFLSERDSDNGISEFQKPNALMAVDEDGSNPEELAGAYSDFCCPTVIDNENVVVLNRKDRLILLNAQTGAEDILTPSRIKCGSASYCVAEDWLIFTGWENSRNRLYVMSLNNREFQEISMNGYEVLYPQVSADGAWLLFSAKVNGNYQLFRASLNGE
jgi:Tol biopolymer transport system component